MHSVKSLSVSYQFPDCLKVGQEVSIFDELSDETEWLLHCHTSDKVDDVRVIALSNLLHGVNLVEEVGSFTPSC